MKKTLVMFFFLFFLFGTTIVAKEDLDDAIADATRQYNEVVAELNGETADYQKLSQQLEAIKSKIILLGEQIKKGEDALIYQKELLNQRVKSYYKNVNTSTLSLIDILVAQNLSESLQKFFYQKFLVDDDKKTIIKVVLYIKDLEDQKTRLATLKTQVDQRSADLLTKISKNQQKKVQLSDLLQQLIAQKIASLNISRSAATLGRCDSDLTNGRDPGFGPKFGAFTYGVPNRVGLNQWGAKGRAESGQNAQQILSAYYNANYTTGYNSGINIHVVGTNEYQQSFDNNWNIEDYLKHLYEMPTDWPNEALKAQAIAARSYALSYTNNGSGSICPNQSCQVVKQELNNSNWQSAVDSTKGTVLTNGGQPIKAWFSSTHGGYVFRSAEVPGWADTQWTKHATDATNGINNFSDLQNNAYDRNSPWFYCDWGSRSQYNKTAWLKSDELADIVNALLLAKKDSSLGDHLVQVDCSSNCPTDIWSADRIRAELRGRGVNPYSTIDSTSVSIDFNAGKTNSITLSGDVGSTTFDGLEFKNQFNSRAPSSISIVGPLYNIEKR